MCSVVFLVGARTRQWEEMHAKLSTVDKLLYKIAKAQYIEEMLSALKRRPLPRKMVRQDLYKVIASLLWRNAAPVRRLEGTYNSLGALRPLPNEHFGFFCG